MFAAFSVIFSIGVKRWSARKLVALFLAVFVVVAMSLSAGSHSRLHSPIERASHFANCGNDAKCSGSMQKRAAATPQPCANAVTAMMMPHENGEKRAGHCGSFMIRLNNSNSFLRSSASWTNWSFLRANALEDQSGDGVMGEAIEVRLTDDTSGTGYDVEVTYSHDKFWSYWNTYDAIENARREVRKLKASSPSNFNARIIRKDVVQ
ncbi:hypothetical protein [Sinorhizobium mexicanum]|uniref:Uncharacterized protein n=1 Tax=Sinorhizobium mexicanum TaxID=375549 RepID=A0A859QU82_9HYPH|nr:hypothetical protein [Sinorhizobium mexicanum]MBP1886335.1 hypothetical protein [Sinorhizobium mexicanum]QLL64056.1 hypothetical protein FKV68_21595 [Sinorhizobium mexicanum]